MAVSYGFYNAIDHDRQYNARQFSKIFDGVIEDGVYDNIGNRFAVTPNTTEAGKLKVNVDTGRAWFNGTWTYNDSLITIELDPADLTLYRMDAIVLTIDSRQGKNNRANKIEKITGTTSIGNPTRPTMQHVEYNQYERFDQYPLAYIMIMPNAQQIEAARITNAVGSSECPFASIIGNRDTRILSLTRSAWVAANDGSFHQVKTTDINGIKLPYTNSAMPILTKYMSFNISSAAADAYNKAFNIVARGSARTGNGSVEFMTYSLPQTDINVALRGQ